LISYEETDQWMLLNVVEGGHCHQYHFQVSWMNAQFAKWNKTNPSWVLPVLSTQISQKLGLQYDSQKLMAARIRHFSVDSDVSIRPDPNVIVNDFQSVKSHVLLEDVRGRVAINKRHRLIEQSQSVNLNNLPAREHKLLKTLLEQIVDPVLSGSELQKRITSRIRLFKIPSGKRQEYIDSHRIKPGIFDQNKSYFPVVNITQGTMCVVF
jgi:hypothetical protein